jgi:hypothetical protein
MLLIHPILTVIALGGLIYAFSPMCSWGTRWPQCLSYGVMLCLAVWCPWPAWTIFLACFVGGMYVGALLPASFRSTQEFVEAVRRAADLDQKRRRRRA